MVVSSGDLGDVPRERIDALLEAIAEITTELDLEPLLARVGEVAARLVGARSAALGVVGSDGLLTQFVTGAPVEDWEDRGGSPPPGHRLLDELVREPAPLRLSDLRWHPSSQEFPLHFPPTASSLGVPLRVGDRVFGHLYLTEKRTGDFDADDEALVTALARVVGIAVHNAHLYAAIGRRARAAAAAAEITTVLLAGAEPEKVLELAAGRAGDLVDAEVGLIALMHGERLVVEVSWGPAAQGAPGSLSPEGPVGTALAGGRPRSFAPGELAHVWPGHEIGPAVAVPLGNGVCLAARTLAAPAFTAEHVAELAAFAEQATVALELAHRRRDAERLSVYADRERIARDLHDLVIQRLFATGMELEGAARLVTDPLAHERVRTAVGDLDQTIREIRSAIYALNNIPYLETKSARARLLDVIDGSEALLGFAPSLRISGMLDVSVPAELAEHLVAVVREGLTNVARHASASRVSVDVEARDQLRVTVVDDGVGIPSAGRRSGLRNLEERALLVGGSFAVRPGPTGGTELVWQAPLS